MEIKISFFYFNNKNNLFIFIIMFERIAEYLEIVLENPEIESFDKTKMKKVGLLIILMTIFILILFLILGKYLWNNVLTEVVPGIKPIDSLLKFIGLWILTQLLFTK